MSQLSFIVIGIPDAGHFNPSPEVAEVIAGHKVFAGAARHHSAVSHLLDEQATEWVTVSVPLETTFEQFRNKGGEIVVFASGDPMFFGIGNTLRRVFPDAPMRLLPYFNSLQQLCHRCLMRYDDMTYVSLTGRPWREFDAALINRIAKLGVLTDKVHTPAAIASRMLEYGYDGYTMTIGQHMGHPDKETISHMSLSRASVSEFSMPNCVILTADGNMPRRKFGIPDESFELLDGRARMITKAPIRLLTLRALGLESSTSFWDIGFCTGSVSIEARLQFPHVAVTSFEIRQEGERLMHVNSRRFGAPGINCLIGDFLEMDVAELPAPDAIFIGGHGGKLREIVAKANDYLLPGGRIVINSVTQESRDGFIEAVRDVGLILISETTVTVDNYHPITIITATKQTK